MPQEIIAQTLYGAEAARLFGGTYGELCEAVALKGGRTGDVFKTFSGATVAFGLRGFDVLSFYLDGTTAELAEVQAKLHDPMQKFSHGQLVESSSL